MPTYKNTSGSVVTADGVRIEPNETVETYSYLLNLPSGVSKISDTPYWNDLIISDVQTGNNGETDTIEIPEIVNGEDVKAIRGQIYCAAGSCTIAYNNVSNTPLAKLIAGYTFPIHTISRVIDSIIINYTADSSSIRTDLRRI